MPVYNTPGPDCQTRLSICGTEQASQREIGSVVSGPFYPQVSPAVAWSLLECEGYFLIKNSLLGTSLVVQWLRICLTMQGMWVQSLVWKDHTCHGATKPMLHHH